MTGGGRLSNTVVAAPAPRAEVGAQPTDTEEVRRIALGNDERLVEALQGSSARASLAAVSA